MLNSPGITRTVSSAETLLSTSHLLRRSSANTPAAIPYAFTRILPMENLVDRPGTRQADGRETRVSSHIHRVLPAALAFVSRRALHFHAEVVPFRPLHFHLRHDEQRGQLCRVLLQQRVPFAIGGEPQARFQRRPDQFLVARRIQMLQYDIPHLHETVPVGRAVPRGQLGPSHAGEGCRTEAFGYGAQREIDRGAAGSALAALRQWRTVHAAGAVRGTTARAVHRVAG